MITCIQKGRGLRTSSFFCCSVMPPKQTVSFGCRQYVAFFQGYLIPRTNTVWLHLQIQSGFPNDCSCLAQRTVEHPHYITTPLRISLSYKGPLCFIYRTRVYERIFIKGVSEKTSGFNRGMNRASDAHCCSLSVGFVRIPVQSLEIRPLQYWQNNCPTIVRRPTKASSSQGIV